MFFLGLSKSSGGLYVAYENTNLFQEIVTNLLNILRLFYA